MPVRLPKVEFVALIAMLFATIAFSIDSMLPALPVIASELTPENPNLAQLILTSFVLGMGIATIFTGPLSDAFGRRPIILGGAAVYIAGALIAWRANSLELMLVARLIQGFGAAGPRIAAIAIVRDLYAGRDMARLMSFVMMVFTLVPAVAPTLGAGIIALFGWRGIFGAFLLFSVVSAGWMLVRQQETLLPANRRAFRPAILVRGVSEVLSNRVVLIAVAAQGLCFAILFANISSIQQIFDITFGEAAHFPLWFGLIGLTAASASLLNATLVGSLGMRRLATVALTLQLACSAAVALIFAGPWAPQHHAGFALYLLWTCSVFFLNGLTLGNLNSIAMEPMGHLAGMAASVLGSVGTVIAVLLAVPVGLAFDGTPLPLMAATAVLAAAALILTKRIGRAQDAIPA
ncbi:multidrug effflux MFS transporter [Tropicimonas isoalkanivorans]|uniref:MFS transporter, DHA1 family, bicyclomycin/chloramphenicol resistance protein n=1 Tax=Tropicimonas isoalkanivorans TaxID=441112 RepID=A0A1I1E820_9RHOB|nr:multidrug effflux MFS transporter [Tropicimonas isoalkanivorans]SFB82836.1 MFS transporter, DHA1 family, bicyclomycin/chloramphenicol resistance protein [Tropicimonas isoalkanivorans]